MKNRIFILVLVLSSSIFTALNAQTSASNYTVTDQIDNSQKLMNGEEEITLLTSFKATKSQRKVINKIKSYVTPRVFTKKVNKATLEGKTVKLQIGLDQSGAIKYITVVNGIRPAIDERVVQLVKNYNDVKPLADSRIEKPSVIQLDIPVVTKEGYYGR